MKRHFLRILARIAVPAACALAVCLASAAPAAADVPPAERLPPDALPLVGSNGKCYDVAAMEDRVLLVAVAVGTHSLFECRRTETGAWDASTFVAPPGFPSLGDSQLSGNGLDAVMVRYSNTSAAVLRLQGGAWSVAGQAITLSPSSSGSPIIAGFGVTDGASQLVAASRTSLVRWRWDGAAWVQAESLAAAQLGFDSITSLRVGGDFAVVCGSVPAGAPPEAGPVGAFRLVALDLRNPSAPLGTPVRLPASAASSGVMVVANGPWLAYVDAQPGNDTFGVRIVERVADGSFVQRGGFTSNDPLDQPIRIARCGVLSLQRALVVRGADGTWRRGVELVPDACRAAAVLSDGSAALAHAGPATSAQLRVWNAPLDRDGNGVRDVDQIAAGTAGDCNRNGIADALDLAAGRLVDANSDGTPDACAADCDANGVTDLTQLRTGARAACDGASLAACAIAAGAPDLDHDGVPDACGPDRNRNGVPDAVEVANGAPDCDHDGIPNGVPLGGPAADGVPASSLALFSGTSGPFSYDTMLATYFPIDRPTRLDSVRFHVAVGADLTAANSLYGKQYNVFVAQDTGGASLPAARLRWSAIGNYGATEWHAVQTPPLVMQPPGFFVGYTAPAGTVGTPNAGSPGFYGLSAGWGYSVAVTVLDRRYQRGWYSGSVAAPTVPLSAMIAAASPASLYPDIEYYASGCTLPGDSDGDGRVDGADLGRLLGAWGPATASSSVCDLNADGSVDGVDLAILLGNFSP